MMMCPSGWKRAQKNVYYYYWSANEKEDGAGLSWCRRERFSVSPSERVWEWKSGVLLLCQRLLSLPYHYSTCSWGHHNHAGTFLVYYPRNTSTISETINLPKRPQVYTHRILFHEIVPRKYRTNTSQNIPGAYISSHTYEYHHIVVHRCQPMEQSTT